DASPAPAARPAWSERELRDKLDTRVRERSRTAALEWLRRAGPSLCADPDRTHLLNAVNNYYWQRYSQVDQAGRNADLKTRLHALNPRLHAAWSTGIDQQIDGLVREFVTTGYLRSEALATSLPDVARLVAGVRPGGACRQKG